MKEGWEYKKLGDFCRKGKNIKWDDQTNDTSFRYIDLTSVDRNDLCIHNPQIITKDNAPSRAKQILQAGDIIFATTRPTLRRVSLIDEQYDGDICSTGFCVLRPNKEVKSKIIFYALLNDSFYKYIEPLQTGANYPAVTDSIVKNYIILVPPLSEQQSIVDYLDSAFAKIDAMKANAEKALNEAKALFQSSLKEMLEPKEGWKEKKIKDIGSVIAGTTPNTNVAEYWDGSLCWISPAELDGSHYLYDSKKKITEAAVKAKSLKLLPEGTVILSSRAPIGKVVINKVPTYCNQGFKCVVCGKDIYNEFLYWWFWGNTDYLNSLGTGATFKEISKKVVEEITLPIPPIFEQQSIVAALDSLKSKVDRLQENYNKISQECDALKQAILRQVFE